MAMLIGVTRFRELDIRAMVPMADDKYGTATDHFAGGIKTL
jgi:hypothetical protein